MAVSSAGALVLLSVASLVRAADPFSWGLPTNSLTNALTACESATFTLSDGSSALSDRTPPFWLYAYPQSGLPSRAVMSESSSTKWTWTPAYAGGTKLTIGVFDSEGVNGGWVGVYTVQSGSSSCLPTTTTSAVNATLNATSVDVCGTLGIEMSGGTPPYTLNILPFGTVSDDVNVTLPSGDAWYSWVAATTSDNTMMIGVRDSTGIFAPSPPTVAITGDNITCSTSSSSSSSDPDFGSGSGGGSSGTGTSSPGSSSTGGGSKSNTGAIVGGVIGGVGGGLLIAAAIWFFFLRKRRSSAYDDGRDGSSPGSEKYGTGAGLVANAGAGAGKRQRAALRRPSRDQLAANADAGSDGEGPDMLPVARRFGAGKQKGRKAGVPEPERDVEKQAEAPNAPITPFTAGLPEIRPSGPTFDDDGNPLQPPSRDHKGTAAGTSSSGGHSGGTRPGTGDSSAAAGRDLAGRGGFAGLRVANPDAGAAGPSRGPSSGSKSEPPSTGPSRQVIQHEDAGPEDDDQSPEELPPAYTSIKQKKKEQGGGGDGPAASGSGS